MRLKFTTEKILTQNEIENEKRRLDWHWKILIIPRLCFFISALVVPFFIWPHFLSIIEYATGYKCCKSNIDGLVFIFLCIMFGVIVMFFLGLIASILKYSADYRLKFHHLTSHDIFAFNRLADKYAAIEAYRIRVAKIRKFVKGDLDLVRSLDKQADAESDKVNLEKIARLNEERLYRT